MTSNRTNSRKKSNRICRFEELEDREMLSADLFNAVQAAYGDLDLGDDWEKYNYIEIQANNLTDAAIRNAIATAGTTEKDDIIVVRTTATQNKITLNGELNANELVINIDADQFGSVTIVSLGDKNLTIDANGRFGSVFNIASASNVALAGLTITGGDAGSSGGGINNAGSLIVTNCTILENIASNGAGINNTGSLIVANCTIEENTARSDGGGINNTGSLTVINSTISGNTANDGDNYRSGGGIANNYGGTTTVINCTIEENTAYSGGGIYNEGTMTITDDSTISKNEANVGAGIFYTYGTMILTNSTIEENTGTGISLGGMALTPGTFTMTHCVIAGNTSTGISLGSLYGVSSITNCTFTGNKGGGISQVGGTLALADCVVVGNTAYSGGGISVAGSCFFTMTNCVVAGNTASNSGGGISIGVWSTSLITNCTIVGNVADQYGGGIFHSDGDLTINNSIVAQNTLLAAEGLSKDICKYVVSPSSSAGSISGEYNLIGNAYRCFLMNGTDEPFTLPDTVTGEPKFVAIPATIDETTTGENYDAADWDLRLQFGSDAINAGRNSLAVDADGQLLTTDLDGNARIFGGIVDLGAYENCSGAPAPLLLSVEALNHSSLVVSWDEVSTAEGYLVQYATDADFLTDAETVTATTNVKRIDGLEPSTVYYVSVATCDSDGNLTSGWSNILTATTEIEAAPIIPTNVTATDVTPTSISLSWTGVDEAVGYEVQYSLDGGRTWIVGTSSDGTTVDIAKLAADENYMFRVRAVMSDGERSDWSDVIVAKSSVAESTVAAAKPKKVAVAKGTEKPTICALTLNITKNKKLSEAANTASYIVFCTSNPMLKFAYTVTGDKVFIEGLQPGTKYTFAVQAIHTNGNVSVVTSVKAATAKYSAVKSLKKTAITADSVTLSWKPSSAPVQTTGYVIEVYDSTGKNRLAIVVPPITDVSITTVTIPGLNAKTKYTFVVKATDGVYESVAAKIKVTTKA